MTMPRIAFRLHQFLSKGDTVYASLKEKPGLTLQGQQLVPDDWEKVLLLVFCRECGQEMLKGTSQELTFNESGV